MAAMPKLRNIIGREYGIGEDDTLSMKNVLRRLGHYETPEYGMTPYPDERMFQGIRGFQKAKGLLVDGVVEPNGPTARALGEALRPTIPRRTRLASKTAASGRSPGTSIFDGLLPQAAGRKRRPDPRSAESERGAGTRLAHSAGQPSAAGAAPHSPQPPAGVSLKGGVYSRAFLDAIAKAEQNVKSYAEVNPGKAWGRYQMTEGALIDAGILDPNSKKWTGPLSRKMGIKGEQDFLRNPLAQEMAIEAYLLKTERALGNKGILAYAGQTIDGIKGNIALTEGRLLAAAHRQGTGNVALYLDHLKRHNWISDPSTFPKGQLGHKFLHVETRLRTFGGISHRAR